MPDVPLVTIVVPNWNTGPLLRVCLASVHQFTRVPFHLVVVDNGSDDESRATAEGAAERGLIELVRRDDDPHDGAPSHGAALDAGLAATRTPYLFTLDSDAWAREPGWLSLYLDSLRSAGDQAAWAGATKFPSGRVKQLTSWLRGQAPGPSWSYVRPCHALYQAEVLQQEQLSFAPWQGPDDYWRTTGQRLHEQLVASGRTPVFLPHADVARRVGHLRHATFVINHLAFPTMRRRAQRRGERQIKRLLNSREVQRILAGSQVP
jgi:glycosyltransferase involved in cell wall biosynthesis